jgi:hypothetical protein
MGEGMAIGFDGMKKPKLSEPKWLVCLVQSLTSK